MNNEIEIVIQLLEASIDFVIYSMMMIFSKEDEKILVKKNV